MARPRLCARAEDCQSTDENRRGDQKFAARFLTVVVEVTEIAALRIRYRICESNAPDMDKRLLGFGVLVLTIAPGYIASHMRAATDAAAIQVHVKEAAGRYAVSEHLVAAVIEVESQFNPHAVSHRGAQGLMQLMPATSASLGVRDAFDPRANIDGGVRHLRWLMDRFGDDLPTALAAYNAGERAVALNRGAARSRETRDYVKRVLSLMRRNQTKS